MNDSIGLYLNDIGKVSLLNAEEERELSRVIEAGRKASGTRDIRCTVSIGGFVPKPHTPFQWAAQLGWEQTDDRLAKLRNAIRGDKEVGKAIGFRYHDGRPGIDRRGLDDRGEVPARNHGGSGRNHGNR